jgi:hypothetical protein
MGVKEFVEKILKKTDSDEWEELIGYKTKTHDFILHTPTNELVYIISRRERSYYRNEWEEIYRSTDPLRAIERYKALVSKVRKEKACNNLMNAKQELMKAESEARKEGLI